LKNKIITPQFLKEGSVVGITCPSGHVSVERVAYSISVLESWGFRVKTGKTIGSGAGYFSGTDQERLADMQAMLDDDTLDAILMGRGGYGMSRIIDAIDFTKFIEKPKWLCGFSDITVLHNHVHAKYGIATLHSPMSGHFKPETEFEPFLLSLRDALTGNPLKYNIPASVCNRSGEGMGVLTGGNLALMAHLTGSVSEVNTEGKILFVEDVGEYLYNIDRMLMNLKRAGKLESLKGIIFGGFTDIKDTERPFGKTIEELLLDMVKEYKYPVCFNFPAGHQDINYTLMLGKMHSLKVSSGGCILEMLP